MASCSKQEHWHIYTLAHASPLSDHSLLHRLLELNQRADIKNHPPSYLTLQDLEPKAWEWPLYATRDGLLFCKGQVYLPTPSLIIPSIFKSSMWALWFLQTYQHINQTLYRPKMKKDIKTSIINYFICRRSNTRHYCSRAY